MGDINIPHNPDAERGLLGAIMLNNRALDRVVEFLRPEHFHDPLHQRVFKAILSANERGERADPVTLRPSFEGDVADGAADYLIKLAAGAVSAVNAADYGRLIHDLFLRRQLMEIAYDMLEGASSQAFGERADEQITAAETALFDLGERHEGGSWVTAADAVSETLSEIEAAWKSGGKMTGVTTGLIDLDRLTGGMKPGQIWILAARPAMGKTALAVNTIARKAAEAGIPVGIFSVEMTRSELVARWIAADVGIDTQRQSRGEFDQNGMTEMVVAGRRLAALPVSIDDSDTLTPTRIRQRAMRMKRRNKVGLFVVDHLQRLSGDRQYRSDYEERSAIIKALKSIAKAVETPILVLSQLSRKVEERDDKRPMLSDLRESGRIEEEADVVLGLYRDRCYAERDEPQNRGDDSKFAEKMRRWEDRMAAAENVAEINILKQRGGVTGCVRAHWNGTRTLFGDLARE